MTDSPRLAVVVKGWPRLSETFIAQELAALEAQGHSFDIWSLRHPTDGKTHPLHDQIKAQVRYLPEYLHNDMSRIWAALKAARRLPGWKAARRQFLADLRRDRTRNRVRRFGQACVLATELPANAAGLYAHFLHTPSSVARYAAILRDLPWSFSAHAKDIWTSPEWDLSEKLDPSRNGATFGVTCTAYGATHLKSLTADPDRVHLVYHGLDLSRFPAPSVRTPRRATDTIRLLSVGRLVEKKGFDRLITSLSLLPETVRVHWTHIGGGDLKAQLQEQANALGLSDQITWRGACDQPEVIAAMRSADLFILPSRIAEDGDRDGLPNVLMEAASQKLPILSTAVSAIPEFITSGTHGLLSDDAPENLAGAILQMVQDPQHAADMAEAAYKRLELHFGMTTGINKLSDLLDDMLK